MTLWISGIAFLVVGIVGARLWYRRWRARRIAARRRVELPNSHYASQLVIDQLDRERWGDLNLSRLHEVNREEVQRLLGLVDALGAESLSSRERVFLDHLTSLRFG
jgi:hypothetical protein